MSHDKHLCPICGNPTSVWYGNARKDGLCREHAQMLKEGKLVQCSDCGSYHLANEECNCKKNINSHEDKKNEAKINKTCLFAAKKQKTETCFAKNIIINIKTKTLLL